ESSQQPLSEYLSKTELNLPLENGTDQHEGWIKRSTGAQPPEEKKADAFKGREQLTKLKRNDAKAVELLVELASLQSSFVTLKAVVKITHRRINAVEHVIIPRLNVPCFYQLRAGGERTRRVPQVKKKKKSKRNFLKE
ncbi:V-type proton ATPase subunit D, partial [Galemys pyrenaicus]